MFLEDLLKGFGSIAPALIAAAVAFHLWQAKEIRTEVNEAISACWTLHHFCTTLQLEFNRNPGGMTSVSVDEVSKKIPVLLGFAEMRKALPAIFELYSAWQRGTYLGMDLKASGDIEKNLNLLKRYGSNARKLAELLSDEIVGGGPSYSRLAELKGRAPSDAACL